MKASDKSDTIRVSSNQPTAFRLTDDEFDGGVPEGAFYVPVSVLNPPTLIQNVLERFEAGTVGDLLELSESTLRDARGVGAKKIDVIGDLKVRARNELAFSSHGLSEASETQLLSDRLDKSGVNMEESWERVLRVLPTRARGAFESVGYTSVNDLVTAYEHGELGRLPNFGPKTLTRVHEILETIATHGLDYYLFGDRGRPENLHDLIEQALDTLEASDRDIVERRFFVGDTFGDIGDDYEVSFQAIQARFDTLVETLSYHFRPEAEVMLAPLVEACEKAGGLLPADKVSELTELEDLHRILFALHLAGLVEFRIWQGVFITSLHQSEIDIKLRRLRDAIVETGRAVLPFEQIKNFAQRAGLRMDRAGLTYLFDVAWEVDIGKSRSIKNPWARRSDHVANVLEDVASPMSAQEILGRLESFEQHDHGINEISERALNGLLHRHEDIYTIERGTYVHASALPISLDALDQVVQWCVTRLRGEVGQISTKYLLGELDELGKSEAGLTPYLLKDALSRHSDVLTFKNTYLVAHAATFEESGKTLADRVETVLVEASAPLTVEDVIDLLPEGIDYHRMSIYTTLLSAPFSLNMGNNRFVHISFVGFSESRRNRLLDAVRDTLPADGTPMSCSDLLNELSEMPEARALSIRDYGSGLLWGLLREHEEVVCGPGELVARDTGSESQHVLRTAIGQIVADYGAAYPREVRSELRTQYGYGGSDSAVFGSLTRSAEEGRLLRLPESLYITEGSNDEILEAMAQRDREIVRLSRSSELATTPQRVLRLLASYYEEHGHKNQLEKIRAIR